MDEFTVTQIKEKYDEIRFYASSGIPEVTELIDEYENLSATICEDCGKSSNLHINNNRYYLTLCEKYALKEEFKRV